ncbi:MAG: hypothetical protein IT384_03165 [Deltaproteobacteria bacterium]|nr:hypothetical protein [Deltaproteobacteria bacterium]
MSDVIGEWLLEARLEPSLGLERWKAKHLADGRAAVVAVLAAPPSPAGSIPGSIRSAPAKDLEHAARITHPNLVSIWGTGVTADASWLATAFIDGIDLATFEARARAVSRPLSANVSARIIYEACLGLSQLHAVPKDEGGPIAHGAVGAEQIVVSRNGSSRLDPSGILARSGALESATSTRDDTAALARVLDRLWSHSGDPTMNALRAAIAPFVSAPGAESASVLAAAIERLELEGQLRLAGTQEIARVVRGLVDERPPEAPGPSAPAPGIRLFDFDPAAFKSARPLEPAPRPPPLSREGSDVGGVGPIDLLDASESGSLPSARFARGPTPVQGLAPQAIAHTSLGEERLSPRELSFMVALILVLVLAFGAGLSWLGPELGRRATVAMPATTPLPELGPLKADPASATVWPLPKAP